MRPPVLHDRRLTGRIRHRVQRWTGRMVLQVEEDAAPITFIGPLTSQRGRSTFHWRDATEKDMFALAGIHVALTQRLG